MKKTRIDSIRDTDGRRPFLLVTNLGSVVTTNTGMTAALAAVPHSLYRLRECDRRLLQDLQAVQRRQAIQKPRCEAEAAGEVCRRAQDGFPHSHWPR